MKDEELIEALKVARNLIEHVEVHYVEDEWRDKMLAAIDHVLDSETGTIAAKQAGWALAHERANQMQKLSTECDLLKLRVAELEKELGR